MTVGELIAILQQCNPAIKCYISGEGVGGELDEDSIGEHRGYLNFDVEAYHGVLRERHKTTLAQEIEQLNKNKTTR